MKAFRLFLVGLFLSMSTSLAAPLPQRVLYIGHRSSAFQPLLSEHFAQIKSVPREQFQPAQAKDFDVVVLDWPQSGERHGAWVNGAPLGQRHDWHKPTVLLGSAGLNLAVAWKLKGGSGCTCLAPVAYNLRDHPIFQSPIKINIRATTNIPTPHTFSDELKVPTVEVLPLVDNIKHFETVLKDYRAGWSTHYYEFADMPEVEVFSGGINEQTPRSAAFWRQGNLLHFGFEQSPAELNEAGRSMLVNALAYISRFTEDQPIDVTPSVFGEEKIGISRKRASRYMTNAEFRLEWTTNEFSPATLASFNWRDRSSGRAWIETNAVWLHPGAGNHLEIDREAKALGVPFDAPDFLPKTIAALHEEKTRSDAAILLARYAPDGPGKDASVDTWENWWKENSPCLFYSELGCYRWYIDPLDKKRGIPTKDLRGPARADRTKT